MAADAVSLYGRTKLFAWWGIGQAKKREKKLLRFLKMERRKGTLETLEGTIGYMVEDGKRVTITDYSGTDTEVWVPEEIEGIPVRGIAKKTFLSRKQLRKAVLPVTIEEVGDWTFAYCTNLESIWLPKREMKLGSRIFMECPKVGWIYAYRPGIGKEEIGGKPEERKDREGQCATLLAASAGMLDTEYLMNPLEAGTESWIRKWDARMNAVMEEEDSEGYTKMILCGEEDYGSSLEEFVKNKRKGKVKLALLRLMNPIGLAEDMEEKLKAYVAGHTKGCDTEESWEVIRTEYGHKKEYMQKFAEIGGVTEGNFDAILRDMPDEYAEMKAFLIQYKAQKMECRDFFAGLAL